MKYEVSSHVGQRRKNNEDSYLIHKIGNTFLFAVCDGMGGHAAGEVASQITCETLKSEFKEGDSLAPHIAEAHNRVMHEGELNTDCWGMGTTCTALAVVGDVCRVGHIGDSRLYHYQAGELEMITHDHTIPYELYLAGSLKKEDLKGHARSNVLTRVIGSKEGFEVDAHAFKAKEGDVYLLCSDGFSDYFEEEDILKFIEDGLSAEEMVQKANDAGGKDNITVLLVHV